MVHWTSEMVAELKPEEVFVFGSNEQGFHGAGTAGLAMRGDSRNNWRTDTAFAAIRNSQSGDRRGRWAVYGQGRGFQEGRTGKSYAVATVTRPGARRSVSRRDIYYQLRDLWLFARDHPEWTFLVTPLGEGYAGWTRAEMAEVWEFLISKHGLPTNIRFVGRAPAQATPGK